MGAQSGFFDVDHRMKRLSDLGDQLEAFGSAVDFEIFRGDLVLALAYSENGQGGQPPFDPVMMFKILVIQAANNLSDERTEFLINDRLSFMRFLGLGLSDRVPDARTIWLFREKLTKAEAIKTLFARFDAALRVAGYIAMSGQIVDASLIAAPRQRNTQAEKRAIKEGRIPEDWKDKPAKLRQKDRDARWTVKFTRAKPKRTAQRHRSIWRSRSSGIKTISRSTAASASFANGRQPMRPPTRAPGCVKDCSIRPIRRVASGPIPPIGRRRMRRSWRSTASPAAFTARSPRGALCRAIRRANNAKSKIRARVEHVFAAKRTEWICSPHHRIARATTKIGIGRSRLQHETAIVSASTAGRVAPQMRPLTAKSPHQCVDDQRSIIQTSPKSSNRPSTSNY